MSMNEHNPFKAPEARVADPGSFVSGDFLPEGYKVPAGNGWDWILAGWELFKLNPGMWIGLTLVYMLIALVAGLIPFIGGLITNLFMPVVMGGIMIGCRDLEEGKELQISHLFAGFSDHLGQLVLVGTLYLVGIFLIVVPIGIVAAIMVPLMGGGEMNSMAMFPLIIVLVLVGSALIIPLVMAYWFAPALVVFHGMPPIEAMKSSFFVCWKNFSPFLVYGLALMVLTFVAMLPCFLGFLVLGPVIMASIYTSYRDLFIQD